MEILFGLPETQIEKLQKVQNTAARILTCTKKYEHITPILKDLHWLPVVKWIHFKILTLTYKCLHQFAPEYQQYLISVYIPQEIFDP